MLIQNGQIFDENGQFITGDLLIEGDRIVSVMRIETGLPMEPIARATVEPIAGASAKPPAWNPGDRFDQRADDRFDATDCLVIPGLVDIHIHGCAGRDSCDGQPGALPVMGRFLAGQGVTTFLPATLSLPEDRLLQAIDRFREYQADVEAGILNDAATAAGLYMEGPFFAREKRGAHAEEYLADVSLELLNRLDQASGRQVRVATVAPEKPGALAFIAACRDRMTVALAHTMADYDTAIAAFDAGASLVTHLFNAMLPFGHREPNVPGAAFDRGAFVELIADGVHLHPAMVRAAFRLYGADRVVLVSDAMAACGMPDGDYQLGDLAVTVATGTARLRDGTIAGSATHLMDALRRAVGFGIPLADAVRAATINPARAVGLADRAGSLAAGRRADLVVLNRNLEVMRVMLRGRWLDAPKQTGSR